MTTTTSMPLGEFLLAGNWVSFPGMGVEKPEFVFAFTSKATRTTFQKKYLGSTVLLPGGTKRTLSKHRVWEAQGVFFLALSGGGTASSEVRKYIIYELQVPYGWGLDYMFRKAKLKDPEITKEAVRDLLNELIAEGKAEVNPDKRWEDHTIYRVPGGL